MMSEKVNDTIALFISKLSETTGYKYLKSRRSLKKTIGQIDMYPESWTHIYELG